MIAWHLFFVAVLEGMGQLDTEETQPVLNCAEL